MTGIGSAHEGRLNSAAIRQIEAQIAKVEGELCRQLRSQVELVETIGTHVLEAGGKRLRPAFLTLSARSVGSQFDPERACKLAACMEMIHMATLIHDDVIDHASTRRGHSTANALYGNTASILSGDVLLSKAMSLLAQDGDIEIIRAVSLAVVELAEGEVRELQSRHRFDLGEEEHIEILRMKTASFMQCCCETGARVAGASEEMRDALGSYGHHVGLAFQIADDLLDYRGDHQLTGKPVGADFREGCPTLPLIYLVSSLSEAERTDTAGKFGKPAPEEDLRIICEMMSNRGAYDQAEQVARRHVSQAIACVRQLPGSPERELLETIAEYALQRAS